MSLTARQKTRTEHLVESLGVQDMITAFERYKKVTSREIATAFIAIDLVHSFFTVFCIMHHAKVLMEHSRSFVDVQQCEIEEFVYPEKVNIIGYKPSVQGHPLQIKRALDVLANSKRPVICVGGGVLTSGAKPKLREFVKLTGIPVVSTMMGIGAMPSDDISRFCNDSSCFCILYASRRNFRS